MFFSDRVPPEARDAYNRDAAAGMLGNVWAGMTGPFVAVVARYTLDASDFQMALISMAPVAGYLFSLIWANWMEGRRKMPFAVWSWVISRAMFALFFFVTSAPVFVIVFLLLNLGASVAGPAYSALMKEIYPDGDRAKIMGYVRVWCFVVYLIVTPLAGWLLKLHEEAYRVVFPVAAIFGIVAALIFNKIPAHERTGDASVPLHCFLWNSVRILWHDPGFRWFSGAIFIYGFSNFMVSPIYAMYQVDYLGVDTRWAGVYSTVASVFMIVAYFYWGGFIDRRRPEKVIAYQALLYAGIPLGYAVATQPWMLIAPTILAGVLNAGVDLAYFSGVLHFAPTRLLTQYQAIFALLMGIRGIAAPLLGAYLVRNHVMGLAEGHVTSMRMVLLMSAAMILVSVLVQLAGARRHGTMRDKAPGWATDDKQGDCAV